MDLRDSPDEAAFREARPLLAGRQPARGAGRASGAASCYDAGYAGLTWPEEYGGRGAPYSHQAIVLEEFAKRGARRSHMNVIALGMAGPTIMAHGTEEQKQRYLPKMLSAEEIWCQGFSEPGAGSDLSAVRTRVEPRDGGFVVNGQKVWSSFAHLADFCILVGAQRPGVASGTPGLTYVIVDMHAPGVEVRPLRQITGEAEFNEIFFTDVEVPRENLLGEIGGGWAGRDDDAAARARHARLRAHRRARRRRCTQARRAREGARRRRPDHPRPRRAGVDRAAGAEADELPLADDADADRHSRARRAPARSCTGRSRTSG